MSWCTAGVTAVMDGWAGLPVPNGSECGSGLEIQSQCPFLGITGCPQMTRPVFQIGRGCVREAVHTPHTG